MFWDGPAVKHYTGVAFGFQDFPSAASSFLQVKLYFLFAEALMPRLIFVILSVIILELGPPFSLCKLHRLFYFLQIYARFNLVIASHLTYCPVETSYLPLSLPFLPGFTLKQSGWFYGRSPDRCMFFVSKFQYFSPRILGVNCLLSLIFSYFRTLAKHNSLSKGLLR